jgi:hypothetical protein
MSILWVSLPLNVHYNENQFGKCIMLKPTETISKITKASSQMGWGCKEEEEGGGRGCREEEKRQAGGRRS